MLAATARRLVGASNQEHAKCPHALEETNMTGIAAILYGRGGSLGNFEIFAKSLATQLTAAKKHVVIESVERRTRFFDFLVSPPFIHVDKIAELHVFAHSIGGGLFLAYGDPAIQTLRDRALDEATRKKVRLYFDQVVNLEEGAVLTDDLLRDPYASYVGKIRDNLLPNATVKLWGCNSGISKWVYTDNGTADPADTRVAYYWRALNERNSPKPSVAQALAWYFKRTVYGASSGSHIEVLHRGHWVTSAQYKAGLGEWPSGVLVHRLNPDRGNYHAYRP